MSERQSGEDIPYWQLPWWRRIVIRLDEGGVIPRGYTVAFQTSAQNYRGYTSIAAIWPIGYIMAAAMWLYWEMRLPWFLRRQRTLWAKLLDETRDE